MLGIVKQLLGVVQMITVTQSYSAQMRCDRRLDSNSSEPLSYTILTRKSSANCKVSTTPSIQILTYLLVRFEVGNDLQANHLNILWFGGKFIFKNIY